MKPAVVRTNAAASAPPADPGGPASSGDADGARPSSDTSSTRASTRPLVRVVKWLCEEQACEGAPRYAYDYLPAVSADGEHVAVVEERDGWGHTRMPGVRVWNATSGAPEQFFPLVARSVDLARDLRRKTEYESLVRAANEGLSANDFRPLFPATSETSDAADERVKVGPRSRGRTTVRAPGIQIEVGSADQAAPADKLDAIVIRQGAITKHVPARDWDPRSGCSTRAFRFLGARADVRVAVFVSELTLTGHNCDGIAEQQPWPVRIVRW